MFAAMLLPTIVALTPSRVHLVDANASTSTFLFRGNNPVDGGAFNLTGLDAAMRAAAADCAVSLPSSYKLVDLDLENPTDPGYFAELGYWRSWG